MNLSFLKSFTLLFFFAVTGHLSYAQPSNNNCSTATTITLQTNCTTTTAGDLYAATSSGLTATCTSTTNDVWYRFTALATSKSVTITVTVPTNQTNITTSNTYIQLYSGSACMLTAIGICVDVSNTLTLHAPSTTETYYVRVFTSTTTNGNSSRYNFTICAVNNTTATAPGNDECANATSLTVGAAATTGGLIWNATRSASIPVGCATGDADNDLWYRFTATSANASINLTNVAAEFNTSGTMMQLFSGSCNGLTSIACSGSTTLYATGLTVGATYFIRVYSFGSKTTVSTSASSSFSIAVAAVSTISTSTTVTAGRMNEVFKQTTISSANALNDPWEIIYGPDGYLWVTESKGYKVYRIDPATGAKLTVLDISTGSTFLKSEDQTFNAQFTISPWPSPSPQGGLAGMALHPKFMDASTPKNYVYLSYIYKYDSTVANNGGIYYTNRLVRFTYNTSTGILENPISLCDTLPGGQDHNSQRMIIAPVNGVDYLFYASGDMGSGQFSNTNRPIKSQNNDSYEGKILRFNLEQEGSGSDLDKWIPSDNPFNGIRRSAVWATGMRNNQGFAYAKIEGKEIIYGSSHGPYSDDEMNIIERAKNYGHPLVIGFKSDGNYNNSKAGTAAGVLPLIVSESANATTIGASYQDPIFSAYAAPQATVNNIYLTNPSNSGWPSEGWSGMDIYTNNMIPGWKNSLVVGGLKWGRIIRLKLNTAGTEVIPSNVKDTISYFGSTNRFRDVAIAPDGKDIYVIMDKNATTSGPSATNPIVAACAGCVHKYTFMGYNADANGKSTISTGVDVAAGTANSCNTANSITIDASNNNIWVPITGTDGNIVAEIKANGNNLGNVTTSYYMNSGNIRATSDKKLYLNRSITINPQNQPTSSVSVRLYLTAAEYNDLKTASNANGNPSSVTAISNLRLLKNNDGCVNKLTNATTIISPQYIDTFGNNFAVQFNTSSFSSFYFSNPDMVALPVQLVHFWGNMQNRVTQLQWETSNENNSDYFSIERSIDGTNFQPIGKVSAAGQANDTRRYQYFDKDVTSITASTIYYRLRLADKDGKFTYSKIISFSLLQGNGFTLYPNPVQKQLNIKVGQIQEGRMLIQLTDLNGRVIQAFNKYVGANSIINMEVSQLKPGVYILQVKNDRNEVITIQKFEKL